MTDVAPSTPPALSSPARIALDRGELLPLFAQIGLDRLTALSPIASIIEAEPSLPGRAGDEILPADLPAGVDLAAALAPLAAPDRFLDLTAATFESAPSPARMCSSRRSGPQWAAVREAMEREFELLAPMSDDHVRTWVRLQLELSAGADIPVPWEQLDGRQLAFLLMLLDAHSAAVHASYVDRRAMSMPVTVRLSDILTAQSEALRIRDRRWLATSIGELFDLVVHPGGVRGVGLPPVTRDLASAEIVRYAEQGWLRVTDPGDNPGLELAGPLPAIAATLGGWLQLVSVHDTQITEMVDGRPAAQHDLVMFVVGGSAIWAVATVGLARAGGDLADVGFRLNTVSLVSGGMLVDALLQPLAADLPDALYEPVPVAAPPPLQAPPAAPQVLPPPPPPGSPPPVGFLPPPAPPGTA